VRQLITAGQVLTGPAGECVDDGAVLVDGDTIIAVGARGEIERRVAAGADGPGAGRAEGRGAGGGEGWGAGGVRRLDFPGQTILPGLINSHVHLGFDASMAPVEHLQETGDEDLLAGMAERARQCLDAGVTTVRDLGDRNGLAIRLRDAIAAGELPGPRIVAAGPPLTVPNGHCWFLGGVVDGDDAIRERVRLTAGMGADVIKVMVSGGQMTPGSPPMWSSQFSTREVGLIVAEATELGLPVAAHAHGTEAIAAAARAGVTTIEHCTWMREGGGFDRRDDVAATIAAKGIYVCSAMSRGWQAFLARLGPDRAEQVLDRLRWLDGLGVRLIPGTDGGLPNSVFDDFAGALTLYEHLGFPPARIIELATVTSAAALGLAGQTGQVAPGYRADLLVVDGDPLAGLDALHRRSLVLAAGVPA
jgi:imidazolonepropionase-like amidohydrolase